VTQGIIDVADEKWSNAEATLTATSQVIGNDPYQIRIAGLSDGNGNWKLSSASLSAADESAGVKITRGPDAAGEHGWLRVNIASATTRAVKWNLKFTPE
jgi:hypothetical protein